ncbi:hypothetical protein [Streptomyces sp. NBC_01304]|uniref:hypothetical protein n=1 Tax=Streptomyces sp. NBC_01304 TaxID=2903818 RepID=UPI002E1440DB|nr:hypothetical protein OG430_23425 [Streptomyces sp. NBC_01304]
MATPHGGRPFVGGKLSTLGSGLDMDLYACMECGYMEHYVTEKGLRTLDKHGTRVPPRH